MDLNYDQFNGQALIFKYIVDENGNPISITVNNETKQVTPHGTIQMDFVPDEYARVVVLNEDNSQMTEVFNRDEIGLNTYYVDYNNGVAYLDKSHFGKVKMYSYAKTGIQLIGCSRIYDEHATTSKHAILTLQEIIDAGRKAMELISTLGDAVVIINKLEENIETGEILHQYLLDDIKVGTPLQAQLHADITEAKKWKDILHTDVADGKVLQPILHQDIIDARDIKTKLDKSVEDAQDDIATIEATENETKYITSNQWVLNSATKMYEYTLTHQQNSKALIIDCRNTDTDEFVFSGGKILDKNRILFELETAINLTVVINSRYYKPQMTLNSEIQEEVVEARKGEVDLKAKITDMDDKIASNTSSLDSKANDNEVRKKNVQIDTADITDTLKQQINGNAPIMQTLGDEIITPKKTTFIKRGRNLINKSAVGSGYVNFSTGNIESHATYKHTEIIRIKPNTIYSISGVMNSHFAFRDLNLNYISNTNNSIQNTWTSPSNAYYIQLTLPSSYDTSTLNEGSTAIDNFEPYEELLSLDNIKNLTTNNILDFYKNGAIDTKYSLVGKVLGTDGGIGVGATYDTSIYIRINNLKTINISYSRRMAFYDINYKFISIVDNTIVNGDVTIPENAYYFRFSYLTGTKPTIKFIDSYNKYALPCLDTTILQTLNKDVITAYMPNYIDVAVGRTLELYNKQVAICGNIDNFHFKWDCKIGKAMKRKFSVEGKESLIGSYPLTLTIYDNNCNIVYSKTATVRIIANTLANVRNGLIIGDSLSNNKPWLQEVVNLSNGKINYVGTRGAGNLKHEARSGFGSYDYLHATSYSYENEGVHPFWDGTRFNWNYYKTKTGINPDFVHIFLGTNGINLDPTDNANNIKQIVDYILQDQPSIFILISNTIYKGNQDGIGVQTGSDGYSSLQGQWKYEEDKKVINLTIKLQDLLKDYSNVRFIPLALMHDSEYNFGSVETPVNPRASQTELIPIEAVHPQQQGYMQIADITFSEYCKYL